MPMLVLRDEPVDVEFRDFLLARQAATQSDYYKQRREFARQFVERHGVYAELLHSLKFGWHLSFFSEEDAVMFKLAHSELVE